MRYFWLVIFVLSVGSVSAQNSARVRELEKQRKAALAEIEMTSQLLDETRQTARNSLRNRLNLLSKQILSRKQVISLLNQEIGEIDKQIAASRRNISQLEKELGISGRITEINSKHIQTPQFAKDKLSVYNPFRRQFCPVPSPYALPSRVCRLAEEAGFRNYR